MFVQSARFVENHHKNPNAEITVYGQEKTEETVRLCKMNLAVHGLEGEIREGNSYYEDIHDSVGKFDFVMAVYQHVFDSYFGSGKDVYSNAAYFRPSTSI